MNNRKYNNIAIRDLEELVNQSLENSIIELGLAEEHFEQVPLGEIFDQ